MCLPGFRISGSRAWDLFAFRVLPCGLCSISGFEFLFGGLRVEGLGFRVQGLGCLAWKMPESFGNCAGAVAAQASSCFSTRHEQYFIARLPFAFCASLIQAFRKRKP